MKKLFLLVTVLMGLIMPIGAVNVGSIAEYAKVADETEVTFTCKLTVLGHKGRKLFVTDGTKGTLIYGVLNTTYEFGDILGEGFTATKTMYDLSPELIKPVESTMKKVGKETNLKPTKMDVGEISMDDIYSFVSVTAFYNPQTSTLKSGSKKLLIFNIFGTQVPTAEGRETIKGIVVYHTKKNIMQLYVL